ncbi:Cytochrome P450 4F8 [Tolypocladium paradoxum]|uniref:Cytochrome P450 4F8 n=1 Tax=Tolypocladium paradoxum TaxID=94208 RepID=A0A2S4L7K8_9HYPO|nr:Cytochrome P450 4F8 [Tolypocladium paradoxum]
MSGSEETNLTRSTSTRGLLLNKIIDMGYWDHYKTFSSSLSRYVSCGPAQEYATTVSVEEARKAAAEWET